jgi:predicted nucleotidyltransferase
MRFVVKYSKLNPKLVILFGSHARGDYTDQSDVDILVVSDDLPADPRRCFEALFDPSMEK